MNTFNSLKKQISTIFSTLLVVGLLAACGSVTDANLDAAQEITDTPAVDNTEVTVDDSIWFNTNGDDMDPIIDRPETGGQSF